MSPTATTIISPFSETPGERDGNLIWRTHAINNSNANGAAKRIAFITLRFCSERQRSAKQQIHTKNLIRRVAG